MHRPEEWYEPELSLLADIIASRRVQWTAVWVRPSSSGSNSLSFSNVVRLCPWDNHVEARSALCMGGQFRSVSVWRSDRCLTQEMLGRDVVVIVR